VEGLAYLELVGRKGKRWWGRAGWWGLGFSHAPVRE
jgi:hypothetical protein